MLCETCGASVQEGLDTCPQCGAELAAATEEPAPEPEPAAEPEPTAAAEPEAVTATQAEPAAAPALGTAARSANRLASIAVVILAFLAINYLAAVIGEVSMAITIVSGFGAPASVIGMACYFGFGIILTALALVALVPLAQGIAKPDKLTRKVVNLAEDLSILQFVALIAIYIAKTLLEPNLITDLQCVMYYACNSYFSISIFCGVLALVSAALLFVAGRNLQAAE